MRERGMVDRCFRLIIAKTELRPDSFVRVRINSGARMPIMRSKDSLAVIKVILDFVLIVAPILELRGTSTAGGVTRSETSVSGCGSGGVFSRQLHA